MSAAQDLLLTRLGTLLSDGATRRLDALATQLGTSVGTLGELLAELAAHGLDCRHESGATVSIATPFVPLDAARIAEHIGRMRVDARVDARWSVDSTNTALLRAARTGRLNGSALSILCAEFQERGRGRQGHSWRAAPGVSLCVSFAQSLPRGLGELSGLSLVCGLASCSVLERHGVSVTLKWPNDLLVDGRKLGGILVEVHPVSARETVVVIGIGINVGRDVLREAVLQEQGGALPPTDLASAGAREGLDRNELVAELAEALAPRLARFADTGFAPFRDDWNRLDAFRDREVKLIDRGEIGDRAIARGVDEQGRLCLDTPHGRINVVAGDVSLRSA